MGVLSKETYVEPDALPEGCVRIRWKGKGKAELIDFRGWRVRLKTGESLVVNRETWDNITNPDLPTNPRNWELVEN